MSTAASEPVIDPDFPICDPHIHLYREAERRYWLEDYRREVVESGHRIERTVYVEVVSAFRTEGPEAMKPVGATDWVASQGDEKTRMNGIVGFADLRLGDSVEKVLAAHELAGRGRFRGIRHGASWDDSKQVPRAHSAGGPGLYERADFRRGLRVLQRMGHSFEAWLYYHQLPMLEALLRDFGDLPVVLNHYGAPLGIGPHVGRREEIWATLLTSLERLARFPNLHIKLGGIGFAWYGMGWDKREVLPASEEIAGYWRQLHRRILDLFGPSRAMCEANWPVDRASCSYRTIWNAFKRMNADLSPADKRAIMFETASRFYRLGD